MVVVVVVVRMGRVIFYLRRGGILGFVCAG